MWSSDRSFTSVHKVMSAFFEINKLKKAKHYFLIGDKESETPFQHSIVLKSSKKATKKKLKRYLLRRRWSKVFDTEKPELIILDGLGMARLLLPILKHFDGKIIVFFHGETKFKRKDIVVFNKAKDNGLDVRLVAVSFTLAQQLRADISSLPVFAIPTFLNKLPNKRDDQHRSISNDAVVFGAVGRLATSKNFAMLIPVIAQLISLNKKVLLVIAGEGEQRPALEELIKQNALKNHIKLMGNVLDMAKFYSEIDALLIPSTSEGQGLIIQEALHYDVPIIANDLPVFREQLQEEGRYCVTIDDWVKNCAKLIDHNERRALLESELLAYGSYNNIETYKQRSQALLAN